MMNFFKNLFGGRASKPASNAATVPLSEDQVWVPAVNESNRVKLLFSGCALDTGQRRDNNEDSLLCMNIAMGSPADNQPMGLYAIADGMGGHRNGEIASEAAVRAFGDYLLCHLYHPLFGPNPAPPSESLQEMMDAAVADAHKMVKKVAPGGGCTLTAALVLGNQLIIGHLGDSRAYAVHNDGRMQLLTRDHTLVARLQEMGQLTEAEAAVHPQKSVLYRALGQGDVAEPDIFIGTLPSQGYLLICSDGLWGVLPEDDIERIVNATPSPTLACQHLVEAANAAGGPDNISVILVRSAN